MRWFCKFGGAPICGSAKTENHPLSSPGNALTDLRKTEIWTHSKCIASGERAVSGSRTERQKIVCMRVIALLAVRPVSACCVVWSMGAKDPSCQTIRTTGLKWPPVPGLELYYMSDIYRIQQNKQNDNFHFVLCSSLYQSILLSNIGNVLMKTHLFLLVIDVGHAGIQLWCGCVQKEGLCTHRHLAEVSFEKCDQYGQKMCKVPPVFLHSHFRAIEKMTLSTADSHSSNDTLYQWTHHFIN